MVFLAYIYRIDYIFQSQFPFCSLSFCLLLSQYSGAFARCGLDCQHTRTKKQSGSLTYLCINSIVNSIKWEWRRAQSDKWLKLLFSLKIIIHLVFVSFRSVFLVFHSHLFITLAQNRQLYRRPQLKSIQLGSTRSGLARLIYVDLLISPYTIWFNRSNNQI